MHATNDITYMTLALSLAEHGRGTTSPNPMVGAVIVNHGRMQGQGYHVVAGGPHAEIIALREAGEAARGATLYVTLEPCCHHGRTPPCTDAIIQAGIARVVVAATDPNPLVQGKGNQALRDAGITVTTGVLDTEATALNTVFNHYIQTKTPYITAKWAMSLDGKTVAHPDDHRQITGAPALAHAHVKRSLVDAILIGANTAKSDNPQLTARDPDTDTPLHRQPRRFILSGDCDLPLNLRLLNEPLAANTCVITTERSRADLRQALHDKSIATLIVPALENGDVDLNALVHLLGQQSVTSLLVEGGMTTLHAFFQANLIHAIDVYLAPVIIGHLPQKKSIHLNATETLGRDIYLSGAWHV